jgi:hypothetical protein
MDSKLRCVFEVQVEDKVNARVNQAVASKFLHLIINLLTFGTKSNLKTKKLKISTNFQVVVRIFPIKQIINN